MQKKNQNNLIDVLVHLSGSFRCIYMTEWHEDAEEQNKSDVWYTCRKIMEKWAEIHV